ncbi:MAG TPA: transporter substrate-binding domain-containing protein [Deltaproteobacteria bacterium]|mgnify:CR=1 FL=1|nr:transporter substrate-binding domain-containing protein [Deltaproteobacteria bacterium]
MKRLSVFIIGLTLFLSPNAMAQKTVTLATLDWQPYVGSDMLGYGFNAEIITEAYKRAGYTVKIEFLAWDDAVSKTQQGEYDGLFPEYYSKDRAEDFIYSDFFSNSLLVFFKKKGPTINYSSLKDLTPYKIGIVKGYINTEEFDSAAYLNKVEFDSDLEILNNLVKGSVDMIVIDKLVAQYLIHGNLPEAADTLESLDPPLIIHPLFIVYPKKLPGSDQKAKDFNMGLDMIMKDGTVKKIMDRSGLQ